MVYTTYCIILMTVYIIDHIVIILFIVYLLSPHSDGDARDLYLACFHNNLDKVLQLLQKGVDPNHSCYNRVKYGRTPLHWTCRYNNHRLVQHLIQWGAGLDAVTRSGATPLHEACSHGSLQSARLMLLEGCSTG